MHTTICGTNMQVHQVRSEREQLRWRSENRPPDYSHKYERKKELKQEKWETKNRKQEYEIKKRKRKNQNWKRNKTFTVRD